MNTSLSEARKKVQDLTIIGSSLGAKLAKQVILGFCKEALVLHTYSEVVDTESTLYPTLSSGPEPDNLYCHSSAKS